MHGRGREREEGETVEASKPARVSPHPLTLCPHSSGLSKGSERGTGVEKLPRPRGLPGCHLRSTGHVPTPPPDLPPPPPNTHTPQPCVCQARASPPVVPHKSSAQAVVALLPKPQCASSAPPPPDLATKCRPPCTARGRGWERSSCSNKISQTGPRTTATPGGPPRSL
jgi:hypothetical protein